jgi:hypothetical protein
VQEIRLCHILPLMVLAIPLPSLTELMNDWCLVALGVAWMALHMYLAIAITKHWRTIEPEKAQKVESMILLYLILVGGLFMSQKELHDHEPPARLSDYCHDAARLMMVVTALLYIVSFCDFFFSNNSKLVRCSCPHVLCAVLRP